MLNLHHLPQTITEVVGEGADLGLRVQYSWERQLLGSAGGPRRALPLVEQPRFLVVNGDTLTGVDLAALCADHLQSGARVTMALVPHPDHGSYGGVAVDGEGRVVGFEPAGASGPSWHFTGVQAVDASVFADLPADKPCDTVAGIYPELVEREPGSIRAFCSGARFRDIGTAWDYLQTSLELAEIEGAGSELCGRSCNVDAAATITRTILWDRVVVGAGARLDRCVVADAVVVPPGAHLERAAIARAIDAPARPGDMVRDGMLVSPFAV